MRYLAIIPVSLALAFGGSVGLPGGQSDAANAASPKATIAKKKGKRTRRDRDGDGISNKRDRDIDGDGVSNRRDRDIDGDRRKNGRDRDIDADGKRNGRDWDADADRRRNGRDRDIDADRRRNGCRDRDTDGDGRRNARDRDVDADRLRNTRDRDIDGDGRRNTRDRDMDGDCTPNHSDDDADGSGNRAPVVRSRVPAAFFGVIAEDAFAQVLGGRSDNLAAIRSTGVGTIRKVFRWSDIERTPGRFTFGEYDRYVAAATDRGLAVMPVLASPPAFRSSAPAGTPPNRMYPPRDMRAFATFARALVLRYGPAGSFWRGRRARPIRSWQVWNEPNVPAYWGGRPNPAAFVNMLRTVTPAMKSADPGAEVVSGGLPDSALGASVEDFLHGMYRAGGRGAFDSLGLHPYAVSPDGVIDVIRRVRRIMNRYGDGATPLRITEVGWGTGGPTRHVLNVGRAAQAGLIRSALRHIVAQRDGLKIRGANLYAWSDLPPLPGQSDFWGLYAGIHDRQGRPKPSYRAFVEAVRSLSTR